MYVAAIDFRKAYDRVRRERILGAMKCYKIDSRIIECVKWIYEQDRTMIRMIRGDDVEVKVNNGIKQGCTGSTILFKTIQTNYQTNYHSNLSLVSS